MRQKRKNTSSNLEKQKKNVLISMNTYICQKIRLRSILIKKENVI